ncbi:MAG: aconitase X swivel domain-containing protein [Thermoplasmata archaeon]
MKINGKVIFPGNVSGEVLKYDGNFSFLGGVDPKTGIVKKLNKSIKDKIFVFDSSAGSTVGSYIIYGLKFYNNAPKAIICKKADETIVTGSVLAKIVTIENVDVEIFQDGDFVQINNDEITLDIEPTEVVTSILMHNEKILILKRSDKVSTYKGKWAGVSGYKENLPPRDAAKKEIVEETGIEHPKLLKENGFMYLRDGKRLWKIYIFLWEIDSENINIDWEHTTYKWINPEEIKNFETVPGLKDVLEKLIDRKF